MKVHTYVLTNSKGQSVTVQNANANCMDDVDVHGIFLARRAYHKYGDDWVYEYVGLKEQQ